MLHLAKWRQEARAPKMYYAVYQPRRRPNIVQSLVDFHLAMSLQQRSQHAKHVEICWGARNWPISAVSWTKLAISWGRVEDVSLFNKFFPIAMLALVAKIQVDKYVRWCPDDEFLATFCVLYFQRATCSIFQTCILNSHWGHIMCRSMVDIQSATADIRRGKRRRRKKTAWRKHNVRICYAGLP